MKKFTTVLVLLFVLSISAFAEGQYPIGGRTRPQGQTCLIDDGQYPAGGKTCQQEQQTCFIDDGQIPIGNKSDNEIIEVIIAFLKSII